MMFSTQGLAVASARHPWRVVVAWALTSVAAMVAIAALLGGALTTDGEPTNDPQSLAALDVLHASFPPQDGGATDVVVVRTEDGAADEAGLRQFLDTMVDRSPEISATIVAAAVVADDRRALLVPLGLGDDAQTDAVVDEVGDADALAGYSVAIAGDEALDHDFNVAVALLIDATLIRSVLLPSVMKLLGEWNWYLPRWLGWLPELRVEGRARSIEAAER